MRNMIIKRHNMASVLIVQALQKGPCGANQIAYTDVGSTDKVTSLYMPLGGIWAEAQSFKHVHWYERGVCVCVCVYV